MATAVTVIGLVWVATYRVTPHTLAAPASTGPDAAPTPEGTPAAGTPTPAGPSGTFNGGDFQNRFGDVQVRVVITNGRITDITALHMPFDRSESVYISQVAGPMLRAEALHAQSAHIDVISGATYTSISYAQSLESALQQAHMG